MGESPALNCSGALLLLLDGRFVSPQYFPHNPNIKIVIDHVILGVLIEKERWRARRERDFPHKPTIKIDIDRMILGVLIEKERWTERKREK